MITKKAACMQSSILHKTFKPIVYLAITLLFLSGCNHKADNTQYQITFAKAYGYVKYFHPSDEAAQCDWNSFAIYGASQIEACQTKGELIQTLQTLFEPIAPAIKFSSSISELDTIVLMSDRVDNFRQTYWQHFGVSIGMNNKKKPYESRRVNRGRIRIVVNFSIISLIVVSIL